MAALGKIRSKGALLISVIGLALFAFIAEEAFRTCDSAKNNERQKVGEVLGASISYQEFQDMVDEYSDMMKVTQGRETLSEDELNSMRDMVWNQYVQNALLADQAERLGLTVTDEELVDIMNQGTNEMLRQTPFVNQQTGRFDANALKLFIADYKKAQTNNPQQAEQYRPLYNFWTFVEKNLRRQTLAQKFETLFAATFLSNPVETKQLFAEDNEEASVELAAFPYSSVQDKDIKISDSDLEAKYKELKPLFRQYDESRSIKYVSVKVLPSATDRAEVTKRVKELAGQLAGAEDKAELVRKSGSSVPFLGVPVLKTAYPTDIANMLDSVSVGQTTALKENARDNTLNVINLISKQELPDSVEYQGIQVGGETSDEAHVRADSIYKALVADAGQWETLARKYGQTGEKQWLTTQQYQTSGSLDADSKKYLNAVNTMAVGEMRNIATNYGNIIVKVSQRKAFKTKYIAAVLKVPVNFSKETYSAAYNKFSQYVSENQTLEGLEKNAAKNGYKVTENADIVAAQHNIADIHGTHEALKWVFDAKEGALSPLYECGDNDNLLVIALTKINKKGYRGLDDPQVKEYVTAEVRKDKKAETLMAKAAGVNSVAAAKAKGAQVSTVEQITFAAPAFVSATGASEPALSGAVAVTKSGAFSKKAVKGNAGVYLFQVTAKKSRGQKFDAGTYGQRQVQQSMRNAGNFMQELFLKADVKDDRYKFF